jgi:hypothetical protein
MQNCGLGWGPPAGDWLSNPTLWPLKDLGSCRLSTPQLQQEAADERSALKEPPSRPIW